ncbi:hypothetical protein EK904_014680 [Melospiza melodia maxima]|nr:hypothetical protein EK904_014680 [Melospiza melodia maxima]
MWNSFSVALAVILRASMGFKASSAFMEEPQCHCLGSFPAPQGLGGIQPVYGAQHPPLDSRLTKNFIKDRSKAGLPMKSKKASSFHEFARSTSDAWDIGDDEDEDFSSSSSSSSLQTLNSKVAKATAAQVLENHSKLRAKPERCQPALGDLPTNCKVIKSSSEAQLSRSSEESCVRSPLQKQQSLPLRPVIPLVARISDQNASGAPPMTVREKTRLEKFRQLLSSHNTDLGEWGTLRIFERILFIWAIRHPASGYVQGINDLVTPFFVVFLSEHVEEDVENFDVTNLSQDVLRSIEADSFWCMSKLLDGIQLLFKLLTQSLSHRTITPLHSQGSRRR